MELGANAQVDHVTPVADGGAMWDRRNLQSLCVGCHESKTAAEHRRRIVERRRAAFEMLPLEHYGTGAD